MLSSVLIRVPGAGGDSQTHSKASLNKFVQTLKLQPWTKAQQNEVELAPWVLAPTFDAGSFLLSKNDKISLLGHSCFLLGVCTGNHKHKFIDAKIEASKKCTKL